MEEKSIKELEQLRILKNLIRTNTLTIYDLQKVVDAMEERKENE